MTGSRSDVQMVELTVQMMAEKMVVLRVLSLVDPKVELLVETLEKLMAAGMG